MEKNILNDSSSITRPVAALSLAAALLVGVLGFLGSAPGGGAQTAGFIAVTNAAGYSQNFDRLGSSASSTNLPPGWFVGIGTGAISGTNVTVGDGSSSSGGSYNWGTSGNSDRALGSLASGSTRATEARFVNNSGSLIESFTLSYTGEQWRQCGLSSGNNDLVMQYFDGTRLTAMGAAFNFNTPYDAGPAGALNGNAASNRVTAIGGTYTPASPITNGQTFYLRWADVDNFSTGNHGMGIDDFNMTLTLITNANLSGLTLSSGPFSPAFDSNTVSYAASVANDITSVTVRPTSADAEATIQVRVNGGGYSDVTSGLPSHPLTLDIGTNAIEVRVTAQGGTTMKTYTLTLTRAAVPPTVNTLRVGTVKDNTLYENELGSLSNGAGQYFYAGINNQGLKRRGLISFDVSALVPPGSVIIDVKLILHMSRTGNLIKRVKLYKVSKNWGEGTSNSELGGVGLGGGDGITPTHNDATWIHTFYDTAFWSNSGGDFSGTESGVANVGGVGLYEWNDAQMVSDVQEWVDHPNGNYGWIVVGDETERPSTKQFDTKENANPARRPALIVTYSQHLLAAPTLTILQVQPGDGIFTFQWPTNFNGFTTQANPTVANTNNWVDLTNVPIVSGTNYSMTLPTTNVTRFFRLRSP